MKPHLKANVRITSPQKHRFTPNYRYLVLNIDREFNNESKGLLNLKKVQ